MNIGTVSAPQFGAIGSRKQPPDILSVLSEAQPDVFIRLQETIRPAQLVGAGELADAHKAHEIEKTEEQARIDDFIAQDYGNGVSGRDVLLLASHYFLSWKEAPHRPEHPSVGHLAAALRPYFDSTQMMSVGQAIEGMREAKLIYPLLNAMPHGIVLAQKIAQGLPEGSLAKFAKIAIAKAAESNEKLQSEETEQFLNRDFGHGITGRIAFSLFALAQSNLTQFREAIMNHYHNQQDSYENLGRMIPRSAFLAYARTQGFSSQQVDLLENTVLPAMDKVDLITIFPGKQNWEKELCRTMRGNAKLEALLQP